MSGGRCSSSLYAGSVHRWGRLFVSRGVEVMGITVRPSKDSDWAWSQLRQHSVTFSSPGKPNRTAYFDPKFVDDKFIRRVIDEVRRDWGWKEMTPEDKERLARFKERINDRAARDVWNRLVEVASVDGGIVPPAIDVKPSPPPRV